jgi:hypothetical protein
MVLPAPPAYPEITAEVIVEKATPLPQDPDEFAATIRDCPNVTGCPLTPTPVIVSVPAVISDASVSTVT